MILNLIPFIGTLVWLGLWIGVAVLLMRQKFAVWEAVLLGFFTELGIIVFVAEGVYLLTQHKTFFGDSRYKGTTTE